MPANLVFRRKIWGARDNGIPPRSTPDVDVSYSLVVIWNLSLGGKLCLRDEKISRL